MHPLHTYITQHRNSTLSKVKGQASDTLLGPQSEDYHQLHHQMKMLSRTVKLQAKTMGYDINKISQLRQSRIAIWTKEEGVRKAQYLAGFRRVLSGERYRKADMEDLKEQGMKYHPLK